MNRIDGRLILALILAAVSCGVTQIGGAEEPVFLQVNVKGGTSANAGPNAGAEQRAQLTRFVERLRAELMVDSLGDANVSCDRCGELVDAEKIEGLEAPQSEITSLQFYAIRNGSQLAAFARAYEFVQASELGTTYFTMEVNGRSPPSAACTTAQIAAGCKTRQLCVQTGGCDKVLGGACDVCKL